MMTQDITVRQQMLRRSLMAATQIDADLKAVVKRIGYPQARCRVAGFATLVQIIIAQLLSNAAANSIWQRLLEGCDGQVTATRLLSQSDQTLRRYGLSFKKIEYIRGLAEALQSGDYDTDYLQTLDDAQLVQHLTKIKGIGQWSAQVYAMTALNREDIFPAKDRALQHALRIYFQLKTTPTEKQSEKLSKVWSPHRSAVALLMWKLYGNQPVEG